MRKIIQPPVLNKSECNPVIYGYIRHITTEQVNEAKNRKPNKNSCQYIIDHDKRTLETPFDTLMYCNYKYFILRSATYGKINRILDKPTYEMYVKLTGEQPKNFNNA